MQKKLQKNSVLDEYDLDGDDTITNEELEQAKEIKETAEKYRKGEYIDIKAISKLRSQQDDSKRKKKTSKR